MTVCSAFFRSAAAAALVGAAGCALASSSTAARPVRAAEDFPARFEWAHPATRLPPADPMAGEGCGSPMVDPRDGANLRLVRAHRVHADYEAPTGRYGVGTGELLRIECNTGRAIGIVAR